MSKLTPLEQAIAERGGHVGEARGYPYSPGWSEPDTSKAAAKSMETHMGRLQQIVLAALRACPRTANELENDLELCIRTVSARITELKLLGKIEDSGTRRKTPSGRNAKVWRAI